MAHPRFSCKLVCGFVCALVLLVQSDESCNLDFEKTLQAMFTPQEQPTTQMRALRRYLLRVLQNMVAKAEEVEGWNTYVYPKRNLEALARAGYLHTLPEEDNQTDTQEKRSFASLVKNGQLPVHHYIDEDGNKRSTDTLAWNNDIKKEIQKMLEDLYTNAALTQDMYTKRNIEKIAREGGFPGKRNAAALLKNDRYLSHMLQQSGEDKRNIASVKAGYKPKYKREIGNDDGFFYGDDSEYPVYDIPAGYDGAVEELLDGQRPQKRFLGRLPKMGKTKTTASPKTQFH